MMAPTILVTGLGRCGTSLVMQMLSAAGIPTVGSFPDFEDDMTSRLPSLEAQREFADRCKGRAVKIIDPHLHAPPVGMDYRTIFLTRHPVEQAKSILKLVGARKDRQARRAMEAIVRKDTVIAKDAAARIGTGQFYNMPFEHLIHDPVGSAEAIAKYVWRYGQPTLDVEAMARCVRRRSATCLPYMLEMELLQNV